MTRRDYLPRNDQTYDIWLSQFVAALAPNAATVGLAPADLVPLDTAAAEFNAAWSALVAQRQLTRAATGLKVTKREESEAVLRPLVQRIQKHPGMTDQLRGLLGLVQEYMADEPIPISELTPLVRLEAAPGVVTVHWGPNPGNERINGKPEGVHGANIYRRNAGETEYQMMGFATKSPYYDSIVGDGEDYVYVVRYRGTKQNDLSKQSDISLIAARGEAAA